VITHLEPDILECKVKGALGSITMTKASGGDGIPAELFQILKDDVVKVLHSVCQQTWKTQQLVLWNTNILEVILRFTCDKLEGAFLNSSFTKLSLVIHFLANNFSLFSPYKYIIVAIINYLGQRNIFL